jgi:hypothetical protein
MHSNTVWSPPFELNFDYPAKTPTFNTIIQAPVSGRGEIRASLQPYPIWEFDFPLNYARGGEQLPQSVYGYLLGFFIQMGGEFSDFLYLDPNDNTVANALLGLGDGSTANFQLVRPIGNLGSDIVQNPMQSATSPYLALAIMVNGTPTSDYNLGPNGIIEFNTAPASGAVLTWTGSYWYRVRFDSDGLTFKEFMQQIFECQSIKLKSVIL